MVIVNSCCAAIFHTDDENIMGVIFGEVQVLCIEFRLL